MPDLFRHQSSGWENQLGPHLAGFGEVRLVLGEVSQAHLQASVCPSSFSCRRKACLPLALFPHLPLQVTRLAKWLVQGPSSAARARRSASQPFRGAQLGAGVPQS